MPAYAWLGRNALRTDDLDAHLRAQRVGVPYTDDMISNASADTVVRAFPDDDVEGLVKRYGEATHIRTFDGDKGVVTEMDALVAYLQVLGKLTSAPHAQHVPGK